jgi:hypothetical protein
VHALSFLRCDLAGVRADRCCKHLANPVQTLSEMVRSCRPGRQGEGVAASCQLLQRHVRPRIPHLLGRLGLVVVEVAAFALMLTYPRDGLRPARMGRLRHRAWQSLRRGDERQWQEGLARVANEGGLPGRPHLPGLQRAAALNSRAARRAAASPASICWFALSSAGA